MLSLVFSRMLFAHTISEEEFKLVRTDKGISLYERWIPNAEDEKVREIKATFIVRSDLAGISRLMTSAAMGTDWNVNAKEYNVIPSGTENTWITYIKYSIPWPFEDQDCCLLYHLRREEQYAEISFESTSHNRFPVYKNITAIPAPKENGCCRTWGTVICGSLTSSLPIAAKRCPAGSLILLYRAT